MLDFIHARMVMHIRITENAPLHYSLLHSAKVSPRQLIALLISSRGMSELEAAKAMRSATFQGTLHRFLHDDTRSPSRATAELIANYFKIPVDAIYSQAVAGKVAADLGLIEASSQPAHVARDVEATYALHRRELSAELQRRIQALDDDQFALVERSIANILDAIDSSHSKSKRHAA